MYKVWSLKEIEVFIKSLDKRYKLNSSRVEVSISSRMTRCKGKYIFRFSNKSVVPVRFVFAKNLIDGSYPEEVVKEVIVHEYAHYLTENDYKKKQGHNKRFKEMCRYLDISDDTYFKYDSLDFKEPKYNFEIVCGGCGKVVAKRQRIVGNKFEKCISRCCSASLNIIDVQKLR